jgi:hypothetical protein
MAVRYEVDYIKPRFFSRTMSEGRLAQRLNDRAANGWRFHRSIEEDHRRFLIFSRRAHFLVFERDGDR